MVVTVKQARILKDLTQKDMAAKLGVHRDTYVKWETNTDLMSIAALKKFLQIVERDLTEISL